jgi:glycerol uptake facilitator-like aquaporin
MEHGISWPEEVAYMLVQCAGGIAGATVAHLMFGLRWYSFSSRSRHGWALVLSEFVATFGLLSVIWGCSRLRSSTVPFAVASYITAAYWFTASTSFANPAVTIARSLSDTFAGIRPSDVPLFIAAQIAGALCATFLFSWLVPNLSAFADQVFVPHSSAQGGPNRFWGHFGDRRSLINTKEFSLNGSHNKIYYHEWHICKPNCPLNNPWLQAPPFKDCLKWRNIPIALTDLYGLACISVRGTPEPAPSVANRMSPRRSTPRNKFKRYT